MLRSSHRRQTEEPLAAQRCLELSEALSELATLRFGRSLTLPSDKVLYYDGKNMFTGVARPNTAFSFG